MIFVRKVDQMTSPVAGSAGSQPLHLLCHCAALLFEVLTGLKSKNIDSTNFMFRTVVVRCKNYSCNADIYSIRHRLLIDNDMYY